VFTGDLMFQSYFIVVVHLSSCFLIHTLDLPVDLFVNFIPGHPVHHGQQFSGESELCVFCSEEVADDDAGDGDSVAA
jgi:hypothetical protein